MCSDCSFHFVRRLWLFDRFDLCTSNRDTQQLPQKISKVSYFRNVFFLFLLMPNNSLFFADNMPFLLTISIDGISWAQFSVTAALTWKSIWWDFLRTHPFDIYYIMSALLYSTINSVVLCGLQLLAGSFVIHINAHTETDRQREKKSMKK